jgi:signal peptidase II
MLYKKYGRSLKQEFRMSLAKRCIIIFVVFITCVGCDQATKSIARSALSESATWSFLGGTVRLHLVYNQGGFLSLGASLPGHWRKGLFIIGAGCLLMGALSYALLCKPRNVSTLLAVALIFAGGAGNFYDRIAYGGVVVDFINIGIGPLRTGIFNVADVAIFLGMLILISTALRRDNPQRLPRP